MTPIQLRRQLLFSTGTTFKLSELFSLQPVAVIRLTKNYDLYHDYNLNVVFKDDYQLGFGRRIGNGWMASTKLRLSEMLELGYSYNSSGQDIRKQIGNTHEVFLSVLIGNRKDESKTTDIIIELNQLNKKYI